MIWGRVIAGAVAGFFFTAALIGLIGWLLPGPWQQSMLPGLVAFVPVWIGVFCLSLLFSNARRAWLWLGTWAVSGLALLWALQTLEWIQ
jgi:hypothetical protein